LDEVVDINRRHCAARMSRLPLVAYLYNHANPVKLMLLPSHDINIQVKVVY